MNRLRHGRPRAAPTSAISALALFLTLVFLVAGCSTRRMALAPALPGSFEREAEPTTANRKETIVVTLVSDSDATALAATYGATLVRTGWRVAALKPGPGQGSDDLLSSLSKDPRVLTAEKDSSVESAETRQKSWAFDDGWGSIETCEYQPATDDLHLTSAWSQSKGQGVRISILDTGAELTHPWIQGRVTGGWDFVDNDADPSDAPDGIDNDWDGQVDEGWGHGTHVAGIAAITAPDADLLIVRVLDSDGRGDMMGVAQGIRWSIANHAKVVSMSLGSPSRSEAVKLALDEAAAAGVVCVAAAGNSGRLDTVEFPANDRQVLAIAAIDGDDKLATFSSYGTQIAVCAPGVDIRSSYRDGTYALWSGTSMATPWVAGGAALLLAKSPTSTRSQVIDRLESTARAIWKQNPSLRCDLGSGALDLGAALGDGPAMLADLR